MGLTLYNYKSKCLNPGTKPGFRVFNMSKKIIAIVLFLVGPLLESQAQSETIRTFAEKYPEAHSLFFYKNTLRMLNQADSKEFNELIKDIDKMKFLSVDKVKNDFSKSDFQSLVKSYRSEAFEPLMSMKQKGQNFDIYIKESNGITKGLVVIINEESQLSLLDIKGAVAIEKIASLINMVKEVKN